jgi:hypothetical protein
MSCRVYDKYGMLALYDELSDSERRELEAHMSTCDACRKMREKDLRLRDHLKKIGKVPAPDLDLEALYARAGVNRVSPIEWLSRILFNPVRGLAFAAVMVVLLVSFALFLPVKKHQTAGPVANSDYKWQSSEDASIEELESTVGSMDGFGTSLYEINKRVERRCSDDLVYNMRIISSYDDEIAVMRKEIESF